MRNQVCVSPEPRGAISRIAHIIERVGLAMAGMLCGLFVAACVIRGNSGALDSIGFVMTMCLIGMVGFYLGIDLPEIRAHAIPTGKSAFGSAVNSVEVLSASGTFLAAVAALISVAVIIFDETPQPALTVMVGCAWVSGAAMQAGAGAIARLRTASQSG